MRVRALVSFVGRVAGDARTYRAGDEFDLPAGVDWLRAGLVAAVAGPAPHMIGVEHAIDQNAAAAERRGANWSDALVSAIDGIGPVTARRLAEAGIETMADLLAADPAHVALIASVRPAQAEKWRQRAESVVRGQP